MEDDKETLLDFSAGLLFIITAHTKHALGLPWITNTVHVYFSNASNRKRISTDFIILPDCADLRDECTLRLLSLRYESILCCSRWDTKMESEGFQNKPSVGIVV